MTCRDLLFDIALKIYVHDGGLDEWRKAGSVESAVKEAKVFLDNIDAEIDKLIEANQPDAE